MQTSGSGYTGWFVHNLNEESGRCEQALLSLELYLYVGTRADQPIMTNTTELPANTRKVLLALVLSSSEEYFGCSVRFLAR